MIGIKRGVDKLGRITVPKEFRHELGLNPFDEVNIILEGKSIRLTKATRGCHKCGCISGFKLKTLDEITLCEDCIKEFNE